MDYLTLISLGLSFLENFLGSIKNKLPAEVVTSIQAAIDALSAHRYDVVTKVNLEAQRG